MEPVHSGVHEVTTIVASVACSRVEVAEPSLQKSAWKRCNSDHMCGFCLPLHTATTDIHAAPDRADLPLLVLNCALLCFPQVNNIFTERGICRFAVQSGHRIRAAVDLYRKDTSLRKRPLIGEGLLKNSSLGAGGQLLGCDRLEDTKRSYRATTLGCYLQDAENMYEKLQREVQR